MRHAAPRLPEHHRLRVLHVNDYRTAGGAERVMDQTVALLRERGHEVETFTIDDVPGHRLTAWGYIYSRHTRRVLSHAIARFKPDVVHLHNYYHALSPSILDALAMAKHSSNLRVVMTAHDYHLGCPNSGMRWFRCGVAHSADPWRLSQWSYLLTRRWDHRGLAHATLKLAQHVWNYRLADRRRVIDLVICPSEFMREFIARTGLPTRRVANPVSLAAPPAATKASGSLRVVFAGRVEPEKGLVEFLETVPIDTGWTLEILGDGSAIESCKSVCDRRGIAKRVAFRGHVDATTALASIAASHLLVLPSRWNENAPLVLIEALASQTNVLACDLGGMAETTREAGVGYLYRPNDAADLARAWREIISRHAAGELNRFDVTDFLRRREPRFYLDQVLDAYAGKHSSAT